MLSKEFILAGNALFTVQNPVGERYTFKINKKEATSKYRETYFVALLTGPDNTSDYTYTGMLNPVSFLAYPTKASKLPVNSTPFRVLEWILKLINNGQDVPEGWLYSYQR